MRSYLTILQILLPLLWASATNATPVPAEPEHSGKIGKIESKSALASGPESKKSEQIPGNLFQFDNPAHQKMLNTPTQPVVKLPDPEVDKLIESMLSKMRQHKEGVGISANQVGQSLQISIVTDPLDVKHPENYKVYINPVITQASKKLYCFWHGCLSSLNAKFGKVATWQEITVSAQDPHGKTFTEDLKGVAAVVFQHEFRHLLGGGYMSHASSFRTEAELFQDMLKKIKEKKFSYLEECQDGEKPLLNDYHIGETIEAYSERISAK